MTWLILIYTLPSDPSRLRATIWRDLKKAGAVYLRDGVAVLPERPETATAFRTIATQITGFGGQATLVEGATLDADRASLITAQVNANREEEYADVARAAAGFLDHIGREQEHRRLTVTDLAEIAADLGKLRRWAGQIRDRDYFGAAADHADNLLARCDAALATFREEALAHTGEVGV
jgi:hypothetical protein